jgi:hypothetical protein
MNRAKIYITSAILSIIIVTTIAVVIHAVIVGLT